MAREITLEQTYEEPEAIVQQVSNPALDQAWDLLNKGPAAKGSPPKETVKPQTKSGRVPTEIEEFDPGPAETVDPSFTPDPATSEFARSPDRDPLSIMKERGIPTNAEEVGAFLKDVGERAQTPMNVRGMLRGGGAAAGGMAGVPFGPGGVFVGTGAGSAFGSYLANVYDSLHRTGEPPSLFESYTKPLQDAMTDMNITGGAQVALPFVTKGVQTLLARLLRLPPNSKELLKEAADIGVDIGVANVAQSGIGRGAVNTLGRVPIIGGSAQNAARTQARQLTAAANDLFGDVAAPRVASEVSQEAYEAGMKKFTDFAMGVQRKFEHAAKVGEEAGAIVPSTKIAAAAQKALDGLSKMDGGIGIWLPNNEVRFLKSLAAREGNMSTVDIKNIDWFLENALRRADSKTNVTHPLISGIRDAAAKSIRATDHPAARLMTAVDDEFQKGMITFGTDTAKNIGRVERNVYATGQVTPGKKTPEELLETVNGLNTRTKVMNMRDVAGDDVVKQAARVRLDSAWQKARTSEEGQPFKWSADKFNAELGLDNPTGAKYETLKEMLRGTGVNIDDVAKLGRVAESVANAPIADVSTFMARAAMLRGAGGFTEALKGALTFGLASGVGAKTGGATGLIGGLTTMWLARQPVGALMRPGMLRAITAASDVSAPTAARASALFHLMKSDPQTWMDIVDEYQEGGQNAVAPR